MLVEMRKDDRSRVQFFLVYTKLSFTVSISNNNLS